MADKPNGVEYLDPYELERARLRAARHHSHHWKYGLIYLVCM